MDKTQKRISILVASAVLVFLTVACVASSSWVSITPLYTYRMEQVSSRMNFLPTEVNTFAYTAENKYTLDHYVSGNYGDVKPLECSYYLTTCADTCIHTCNPTCDDPLTCKWSTCKFPCLLAYNE